MKNWGQEMVKAACGLLPGLLTFIFFLLILSSGAALNTDNRQLVYDGKTITLLDRNSNFYTTIAASLEIDAALEHGIQAFNLRAPLADLIYTKSYEYLTEGCFPAFLRGTEQGRRFPCHHLAFKQKDIDQRGLLSPGVPG